MTYKQRLRDILRKHGEWLSKKHGDWRKIKVFDNHFLIHDTWNGEIYHYPNGATPSDRNNIYGCVYAFYDKDNKTNNYTRIKGHMFKFWYAHLFHLNNLI